MPLQEVFAREFKKVEQLMAQGYSVPEAIKEGLASKAEYVVPPDVVTSDTFVSTSGHAIAVRVYQSKNPTELTPAVVWFHGGGFVQGDINTNEAHIGASEICARTGALVINVEYRLVTETVKLPAPLEDGFEVTKWLIENAADLGVDPTKIFVAGASAGGSLAASVALMAREQISTPLAGVIMYYPVVHRVLADYSDELAEKVKELPGGLVLGHEYVARRNAFLAHDDFDNEKEFGWPGDVKELKGFPNALVLSSEYDGVRASAEQFALSLRAAGVKVETHVCAGMPHAFLNKDPKEFSEIDNAYNIVAEFISKTKSK